MSVAPPSRPPSHPRLIPLIVACALFMETLDSTIIATALPQIARAIDEDPLHLSLAITSYLLSLAVCIPLSGWVADRYGARRVFRQAIVLFAVGSLLCGLSQSLGQLIGARIVQGLGGAMMVPVGRLVLLRKTPKHELVAAMSWLTIPALLGPLLGPPLGGFIVTWLSWRWIFFINLPIAALGYVLVTRYIGEIRAEAPPQLDLRGWLLLGSALALLVLGFEQIGKAIVPAAVTAAMLGSGGVLLLGYLVHARHHRTPIIRLDLLRVASFRASSLNGNVYRACVGAYSLLMPLMLQIGFGLSAAASGSITFVAAIGAIAMKTTAPRIVRRFGFRTLLVGNGLLSTGFLVGCGLFTALTPHALLLGWLMAYGFFRSLQFTCLNTLAFADVGEARMSQATSLSGTMQQLAMSVGVGVAAQLLNVSLALRGGAALQTADFRHAFFAVAAISAISALGFRRLRPDAGAGVSGHARPPPA